MVQPNPRKFFTTVAVEKQERGICILLDGKPLRTPARTEVILPNQRLAQAIAEEWRAQEEKLRPDTMPLTRLANTAVDRVAPARAEMVERIMAFGRSDLVCYRAGSPSDLVERQSRVWDPLLSWLRQRHGAELQTCTGIEFIAQPEEALRALTRAVEANDDFVLAAIYAAASLSGSLVIALAMAERQLDAEAAFAAAHLDEAYQAEKWGTDPQTQARAERVAAELMAAERFLAMLKES